ncbi:hypothetical protein HDK64DRAFT_330182 [Phyllosticta capitalensis]|uniref:F-box domain-containing protein n=1 Tax=Phyllosticta capitalensis TaxID=121624 RepID=A0ABR1YH18_9PEZI
MADPQLAATAKKAEESTSEPTTSQDVVEISPGQDLTVVLKGGNIRLKIEQDVLGKINISGVRTGSLRPTLVERPGSFDVTLAKHQFGDKFDFLGLPGEIRNRIYSFVFEHEDSCSALVSQSDSQIKCFPVFYNKRALWPVRFLARMNGYFAADCRNDCEHDFKCDYQCGIPFLNHQTSRETTPWLMSRHFVVDGDKQALALCKSINRIGFYDLEKWDGSLYLSINQWQGSREFTEWVPLLLDSGWSREIVISGISPRHSPPGQRSRFKLEDTPLGQQLVACGRKKLPTFVMVFQSISIEVKQSQINYALSGFASGLSLSPQMLLAKRIYEAMQSWVSRGSVILRTSPSSRYY